MERSFIGEFMARKIRIQGFSHCGGSLFSVPFHGKYHSASAKSMISDVLLGRLMLVQFE